MTQAYNQVIQLWSGKLSGLCNGTSAQMNSLVVNIDNKTSNCYGFIMNKLIFKVSSHQMVTEFTDKTLANNQGNQLDRPYQPRVDTER